MLPTATGAEPRIVMHCTVQGGVPRSTRATRARAGHKPVCRSPSASLVPDLFVSRGVAPETPPHGSWAGGVLIRLSDGAARETERLCMAESVFVSCWSIRGFDLSAARQAC